MKIIFMGTPEIAVPCLKALCHKGYEIPLVVTQPDKPKGRGKQVQYSPVKEYALSVGLEVYQPERLKGNEEALNKFKEIAPDFYAVAAYGRILPKEILDVPLNAPVNVHFSLLPKYRGAAPVNWAIVNGDEVTGVSTMLMDIGMDTGDILLTSETPIGKKNAAQLGGELAETGAKLLIETLENFHNITPIKQDESNVSIAPIMRKDDGWIDWSKPARYIENIIRGFYPWPAAYSFIGGKMMKFFKADIEDDNYGAEAGTISKIGKDYFAVSTGVGSLIVRELQLEGKKLMDTKSFLAGSTLTVGMKFERKF